jgi:hypothetical protein
MAVFSLATAVADEGATTLEAVEASGQLASDLVYPLCS